MSKNIKALRIAARMGSFRRCGIEFGSEPKEVSTAYLKADQIEALKNEPMLVVVEIEAKAKSDAKDDKLPAGGEGDKPPAGGEGDKSPTDNAGGKAQK